MNRKKAIFALVLFVLGIWLATAVGGGSGFKSWINKLSDKNTEITSDLSQRLKQNGSGVDDTDNVHPLTDEQSARESMPPFPSEVEIPETPQVSPPAEKIILPTTIQGGMVISNDSGLKVDLNELVSQGTGVKLCSEGAQILIVHTHGSEAYTSDGTNSFTATDAFRTEDNRYNMIRVGDELAACLESYGLTVIHDREIYDYPSYTGSYGRSATAVSKHLQEHPEISVIFDVHRDAIGNEDVVYKTMAEGDGKPCSQLMLLAGTGENGLPHPNWKENLKLALYLQSAVISKYPTLARPIALKKERYNQQLSPGSLILEVGSNGNTLEEALCAVRYFADSVAPALLELKQS